MYPFSVHYGGGFWGVVAVTLFNKSGGVFYEWNKQAFKQLGWNLVGAVTISAWAAFWGLVIFSSMKLMKILRVSRDMEINGIIKSNRRLLFLRGLSSFHRVWQTLGRLNSN